MTVPAVVGLLLAVYITAWLRALPESSVVEMLDRQVAKAQAERDWSRVRVGLQAILERRPDSQPHQFAYALLLSEEGDLRSAAAMIARLAPQDRVGYPPAHRLLAEEALARYGNAGSEEDRTLLLKTAIHHLEAGGPPNDPRWAYRLGILHAGRDGASAPTAPLTNAAPPPARGTADFGLLLQALQAMPGYPPAVQRFRSGLLDASEAEARRAQDFVTRQLAAGEQPAVMHYLLGVRASAMQRWGDAIQHLEQAQRLRPLDVTVQYQLARALLRSPTSNMTLEQSAALIQTALRRWPNHPELLVTSGEVRLRQGDVGGAVSDLEKAIARLPSPAVAHRLLAEAYQRLGNQELSQRHRELAAQDERTNN